MESVSHGKRQDQTRERAVDSESPTESTELPSAHELKIENVLCLLIELLAEAEHMEIINIRECKNEHLDSMVGLSGTVDGRTLRVK